MPTPLERPLPDEYADFYHGYVARVPDGSVLDHLRDDIAVTCALLEHVDETRAGYRYADGKWSVREVLGHMIDAERVMAHRALAIARRDLGDQPSMDENAWMAAADFDRRPLAALLAEWRAVRAATLALFSTFDAEVGRRTGRANSRPFSVRSLVWITAGHELHHRAVLQERYGLG